jgi:hypothetical protein
VQPAFGDKPERPVGGYIGAEIDLHVMIAGHALILSATKSIKVIAIEGTKRFRYIFPVIVDGTRDRLRLADRGDGELYSRDGEAFIGEDFSACGVIDGHQAQ